jgi:hypothetical protein
LMKLIQLPVPHHPPEVESQVMHGPTRTYRLARLTYCFAVEGITTNDSSHPGRHAAFTTRILGGNGGLQGQAPQHHESRRRLPVGCVYGQVQVW